MSAVLKSRLPLIAAELKPRVGAALAVAAERIAEQAKNTVPVDQGDLRDAIHVERNNITEYAVVAGNDDVFYGHLVEHGTTHSPAQPFLVPAAEAVKEEVVAGVVEVLRGL